MFVAPEPATENAVLPEPFTAEMRPALAFVEVLCTWSTAPLALFALALIAVPAEPVIESAVVAEEFSVAPPLPVSVKTGVPPEFSAAIRFPLDDAEVFCNCSNVLDALWLAERVRPCVVKSNTVPEPLMAWIN